MESASLAVEQASQAEIEAVLQKIPQQKPFRFIDRIIELTEHHIVAEYRFREDEFFYRGHFPGDPVTPGVILAETMAQAGLVALGIYLIMKEAGDSELRTLFTECSVEFVHAVPPGALVTVEGKRSFWRRHKLQSRVELKLEDGTVAAHGLISGLGVKSI